MIRIIVGYIFLGIGSLFLLLSAIGIIRLPDVYNRLQAGTKAATLGALSALFGVGIIEPEWFWKCFVIAIFILLTNPVSSHAIARASYKAGVKLWKGSVVDKYKDYNKEENEKSENQANNKEKANKKAKI